VPFMWSSSFSSSSSSSSSASSSPPNTSSDETHSQSDRSHAVGPERGEGGEGGEGSRGSRSTAGPSFAVEQPTSETLLGCDLAAVIGSNAQSPPSPPSPLSPLSPPPRVWQQENPPTHGEGSWPPAGGQQHSATHPQPAWENEPNVASLSASCPPFFPIS
jgi:hypothetical protein